LGFLFEENVMTPLTVSTPVHPTILRIQALLRKIDHLILPPPSRRDVESILVRQASKEIDRALPWQAGHGRRAAELAVRLGQAAGLDPGALHQLKLAAFLHDLGLLMLPQNLTAWPDTLSADAYLAVQNHSRLGAELLEPFSFLREAATIIAHHHERWDGYGYPYGLRRELIPTGSRILAVADTYDAILSRLSRRRWSGSLAHESAWTELRAVAGSQLDPSLVTIFCDLERGHSSQRSDRASERAYWSRLGAPG